jgi:hypothetical protein
VLLHRNGIVSLDQKQETSYGRMLGQPATTNTPAGRCMRNPTCSVPRHSGGERESIDCRESSRRGAPFAELLWQEKALSNDILSSALHEGYVYGFGCPIPPSATFRENARAFCLPRSFHGQNNVDAGWSRLLFCFQRWE